MGRNYKAFFVEEIENNVFRRSIINRDTDDLPDGDVLIQVHYSSLNYKDALSASGHKGITRRYPHQPGIDAAGIVSESNTSIFKIGDEVLVTGYDLGMNTYGGYGQFIRVPEKWIVRKPVNMSLRETMIYGTAGFTAGLAIFALQQHSVSPGDGKILVTGASGGVGSLSCGMLAKLGYDVEAATSKNEDINFWNALGIKNLITRDKVFDMSGKPLLSAKWKGAIECVGGNTLSTVIRSISQHGTVCCLGNVEDDKFHTSVYPFLLRGINLIGIDSAETEMINRKIIWEKIANEWKLDDPEFLVKEIGLDKLSEEIDIILNGKQKGKILINLNK